MKILKKISKVIVIVMAVLATIWCGLYVYANYFYNDKQIDVENFYIAELPLTPSQFEEDFKEIHQIVMENYSLYQAKHLNMDSLYQACDARVRQAQTTTDYGLIVQEYISALQCAHAITCYKRYTANQRVAFIEDSLILSEISDNNIESFPNCWNIAQNFRRSFRRSASACRFVMVRAEYLSPGCNRCPYPTYG